jgi:hypothetical protein
LGYSNKEFDGNLDIGRNDFTPARFQEIAEERELFKAMINYSFLENQAVALHFSQLLDGRNTINDDGTISLSYAITF